MEIRRTPYPPGFTPPRDGSADTAALTRRLGKSQKILKASCPRCRNTFDITDSVLLLRCNGCENVFCPMSEGAAAEMAVKIQQTLSIEVDAGGSLRKFMLEETTEDD